MATGMHQQRLAHIHNSGVSRKTSTYASKNGFEPTENSESMVEILMGRCRSRYHRIWVNECSSDPIRDAWKMVTKPTEAVET